jgi:hypothetical protein
MASGRNGDELGDSFNDSEYDDNYPVRHPWDKREIGEEDKRKCETGWVLRET